MPVIISSKDQQVGAPIWPEFLWIGSQNSCVYTRRLVGFGAEERHLEPGLGVVDVGRRRHVRDLAEAMRELVQAFGVRRARLVVLVARERRLRGPERVDGARVRGVRLRLGDDRPCGGPPVGDAQVLAAQGAKRRVRRDLRGALGAQPLEQRVGDACRLRGGCGEEVQRRSVGQALELARQALPVVEPAQPQVVEPVSARTLFDGAVITVFDGRRSPTGTMGAGCRMAVTESSRYAARALRLGPSGDPPPSTRRSAAMAVSQLTATGRSPDALCAGMRCAWSRHSSARWEQPVPVPVPSNS